MKAKILLMSVFILSLFLGIAYLIHAKPRVMKPKTLTPKVIQITPLPESGGFFDGTHIVIYGMNSSSTPKKPVIIKMDTSGNVLWKKEYGFATDVIPVKVLQHGSAYLIVGKNSTSIYLLKVDSSNGNPIGNLQINPSCTPLSVYNALTDGNDIYILGQCSNDSMAIRVDSSLNLLWANSYNMNGTTSSDSFRTGIFNGSNIELFGMADFSGNLDITQAVLDSSGNITSARRYDNSSVDIAYEVVKMGGDYYLVFFTSNAGILKLDSSFNVSAAHVYPGFCSFSGISVSGSNLLLWGSRSSGGNIDACFTLINPSSFSSLFAYAYGSSSITEVGTSAFAAAGGHILVWNGSAYLGFADASLSITGFGQMSSVIPPSPTSVSFTPTAISPLPNTSPISPNTNPVSVADSAYSGSITTIYQYTPPSGGGGGGPIIIPPPAPPQPEPPPPEPEPPPPPPPNISETPAITVDGESIIIRAEVPLEEAKITSVEYTPPAQCPTPSTFVPVYGGVGYSIEPTTTAVGGSAFKQAGRFSTTLTIDYQKELNPRAKVFACTSSGCTDITSLATIQGSVLRIRVEDGSIIDEDGLVNGNIKTKSFVYAVVPEEYRKGGGCSMGSSVDLGLMSLLLLPLLMLVRRYGLRLILIVLLVSLPSFASMERIREHMREGEYEEALPLLEDLIKKQGLSEERSLLRSYILLKTGNIKQAIKHTEEDLKFIPSKKLRLRLAYLYGADGQTRKARGVLRDIREKDEDYYFLSGYLHFLEGNFTKAKYDLSKVSRNSEHYNEAQLYLAQVYSIEGSSHGLKNAVSRMDSSSEFYFTAQSLKKSHEDRKKLNFTISIGTEYDTNLLGVFELQTKTKTWKSFGSLSASYEGDSLKARARAYISSNQKGSSYNLNFYSLELEPLWDRLSFPTRIDHITLGGDFYANMAQLGIAYKSLFGSTYLSLGYQNYLSQPFDFENRDGYFLQTGHRYEYFSDKLYFNFELFGRHTDTKGKNWDSLSGGIRLFGNYALNRRFSAGINSAIEGTNYISENQAFLKRRRDLFFSISPFLNLNIYNNFSLMLSYTHMRNLSSINYYSYRRNLYTIQLIGRF